MQRRHGITGLFGNTAVMASVVFRVLPTPQALPILEGQSSIFFEVAEATWKNSGNDVLGTRLEERLGGNQDER